MSDVVIKNINLESELYSYNKVFQVGEKTLTNIITPVQDIIDPTIQRMRDYKQSVIEAVAEIKAKEEADRIAAEEAARQAEAARRAEATEYATEMQNNMVNAGADPTQALGAYVGSWLGKYLSS